MWALMQLVQNVETMLYIVVVCFLHSDSCTPVYCCYVECKTIIQLDNYLS